jgi:hypothetical protein
MAESFGQWVQIRGRVRVAETSAGRLSLIVQDARGSCLIYVMGEPDGSTNYGELTGAEVQVHGINGSRITEGKLERASLTAPNPAAITILRKDTEKPAAVTSIDRLLSRPLGPWTNEPVRLTGIIESYKRCDRADPRPHPPNYCRRVGRTHRADRIPAGFRPRGLAA